MNFDSPDRIPPRASRNASTPTAMEDPRSCSWKGQLYFTVTQWLCTIGGSSSEVDKSGQGGLLQCPCREREREIMSEVCQLAKERERSSLPSASGSGVRFLLLLFGMTGTHQLVLNHMINYNFNWYFIFLIQKSKKNVK